MNTKNISNITKFLDNDNIKILWDVIIDEEIIKNKPKVFQENIFHLFMNNIKGFFEFYKWFNTNIGKFIEQLIPRKTRYNGINYVITSHLLERSKVEYHCEDIYIGESNRNRQKDVSSLQIVDGLLRKY